MMMTPLTTYRKLIEQHGLDKHGWRPRLLKKSAYRTYGQCRYRDRTLAINQTLCRVGKEEEVLDTMLHEIAHALAYHRHGECCRHDYRWKRICREIGASPTRLANGKTDITEHVVARSRKKLLYAIMNVETGVIYAKKARIPKGFQLNKINRDRYMIGKKHETLGKLIVRELIAA